MFTVKNIFIIAAVEAGIVLFALCTHELGHLAGGFLGKHRFEFIRILGLGLVRNETGGVSIELVAPSETGGCLGQCILTEQTVISDTSVRAKRAAVMISGGAAANILMGIVLCLCSDIPYVSMSGLAINMIFAATSLFGGGYCDGATLAEIMRHPERVDIYFRLMKIASACERGKKLNELPEEWFDVAEVYDNTKDRYSLVTELHDLFEIRRREI